MPSYATSSSDLQTVRYLGSLTGCNNDGMSICVDPRSKVYYIKKRVPADQVDNGSFDNEVQICNDLKGHSNIASIMSYNRDGRLWMRYYDLGTLDDMHERATRTYGMPRMPQDFIFHVATSVLQALCWMHEGYKYKEDKYRLHGKIIHNDVKADNIFLTSETTNHNYPKVVLGDFGIAVSEKRETQPHYRRRYLIRKRDLQMLGNMLARLCGAGKPKYDQYEHMSYYPEDTIKQLSYFGIDWTLLDVIGDCWKTDLRPTRTILGDALWSQQKYLEKRGGPSRLPSEYEPRSKERQPNNGGGWGGQQLKRRATGNLERRGTTGGKMRRIFTGRR